MSTHSALALGLLAMPAIGLALTVGARAQSPGWPDGRPGWPTTIDGFMHYDCAHAIGPEKCQAWQITLVLLRSSSSVGGNRIYDCAKSLNEQWNVTPQKGVILCSQVSYAFGLD